MVRFKEGFAMVRYQNDSINPWLMMGMVGVIVGLSFGCSSEKIGQTNIDPSLLEPSSSPAGTPQIVPASAAVDAHSPAKNGASEIDDFDPLQVCQRFMELLQSGNRLGAENFLTKKALVLTGKAGLVLEPIVSQNAPFVLAQPAFNNLKNEVAYIDCQVDDDSQGSGATQLTWILKKQTSSWRISGLMIPTEKKGGGARMVSLENAQDVEWMRDDFEDEPPTPTAD
jgi:hypothetical protein